ncbi:PREDICTED: cholesterol 7-desaturase-like [Acropora digitifera]|uniref:cholesterol 7-desaturase-like n=1 Tax=Acropora digitifera TaxID=70779 RepID=UPI00077AF422|nr:PREDICTED: cholesterol 7-desaturase-like [Acropora digitifera]
MYSPLGLGKEYVVFHFLAVATAASPMLPKLSDFSNSVLSLWSALLTETKIILSINPWLTVAGTLIFCYAWLKLWKLLFAPLEIKRDLRETGYTSDGKQSLKDIANEFRKRRQFSDIPPVYPNGWFRVLASSELAREEVKYISVLGQELAVFRGNDGVVYIVNAYCPHMGANVAIGGKVVGNCLQCPFHGWKFRGDDGKCVEIPYSKTVPLTAKMKTWPSIEMNRSLLGKTMKSISWPSERLNKGARLDDRVQGEHIVPGEGEGEHCHIWAIYEIPENAADVAHFVPIHAMPIVTGSHSRYNFSNWCYIAQHEFNAGWEPQENEEKHVGILQLDHALFICGYKVPFTEFHLIARQIGPGLVFMKFKSAFGDGVFLQSLTPKEPLLHIMRHEIYAAKTMPTFVAKFLLYAEAVQVERDIMIWNHKIFLTKPLLVKEDHSIKKHRRWFSQFYSENSPRLTMRKETLDW